ncbi:MAG: hypothetical protein Q4B70_07665 [Lachnospiraceae bacterium]|nr:hypothetical protein [Lachnospiraceae bacterium]
MKYKPGKRGNSICKVIVVAALIAVLVGILVPVYHNYNTLQASRGGVTTTIEP